MKSKKLALGEPPLICYLHHAYPLSISASSNYYLPWFYSHFIQLCCPLDFPTTRYSLLDFYPITLFSPGFQRVTYNRSIANEYENGISQFVIDKIQQDYYVRLYVDEYYIPERDSYKTRNLPHYLLVFGYDKNNNLFNIAGFNEWAQYTKSVVSFDEVRDAFNNYPVGDIDIFQYHDVVCSFELEKVTRTLKEYLFSLEPSEGIVNPYNERLVFGIEIYRYLKKYLENLSDKKTVSDIRPFHLLWEHKKCMVARFDFIQQNIFFDPLIKKNISTLEIIENEALKLKSLFLKYQITKNEGMIEKIINKLYLIQNIESVVLHNLINILT